MEKKLTSVHVLNGIYKKFKIKSIDSGISLQKLVNRALDLYTVDENFKNKIDGHNIDQ
jgi:hypothetical protein